MAILEVEDIHTYYGDAYVLQGLSLKLEQGQILGLLGRNGVGKTTLVNSVVGFNPPRRGRVRFKDADITGVSSFETVRMGMGLRRAGGFFHRSVSKRICSSPSAATGATAGTSRASTHSSHGSKRGAASGRARSRAASSRCSPSRAGS